MNNKKIAFETKKKELWSQSYIRQFEPHFYGFWRSKTFLKWKNTMLNFRNINSFQHLQEDLLKFQLLLSLHFSKVRLLFDHQRLQILSTNAFWDSVFFRVLTRTFPGSKILGRKTSTRSVRTFNIWKRLLFLRMNFWILKYYKGCKSACCHTFQTQKQEYVYILSLTNKKHVPVIMCFRFPNVRKTWE